MADANTISCPRCGVLVNTGEEDPLVRVLCPKCREQVRAASRFDDFEILEVLGVGGMSTVYRARDMRLGREVALKLLHKDLVEEFAKRLQDEARVTASINHPNVVQVFSFGQAHDHCYMAMELVDGGTLEKRIESQERIPENEALRTGLEAARGLRAAFRKNLLHGDVKPGNILFNAEGTAKISDFGLSDAGEPLGTSIWGTPYYVAPERLNNSAEDFRSDVYSLGATLFHAIAGQPPFEGETTSPAQLRALKNNPTKLAKAAPAVSHATAIIIDRMIAPDPLFRFSSYDDLIAHLERARRYVATSPVRRRSKIAAVGLSLLFLMSAAVMWFLHSHQGPAAQTNPTFAPPKPDATRQLEQSRRQLIGGNYEGARVAFAQIAAENRDKQPIYSWALLNQALASLLDNKIAQMREPLGEIEIAGPSAFADPSLGLLLVDIARRANARTAISISDVPEHPARPFALLFFGLLDTEMSRFDEAAVLLSGFVNAKPRENYSWIMDYKPIGEKYLNDLQAWLGWRQRYQNVKSVADLQRALEALRQIIPSLQTQTAIAREAALQETALANQLQASQMQAKARGTKRKAHRRP